MRKILTIGLFLALSSLAAAQTSRRAFSTFRETIKECKIRWPDFKFNHSQTPDTVSIVFLGDMMMHSGQIANAKNGEGDYDFSLCFPKVEHLIREADIAVANMEFTLAGEPYTGYPCFSAPDSYAEAIAESGVDIFLTANNHILDKGRKGIERTLEAYSEMEGKGIIQHTGAAMSERDDSLRFPLKVISKGIRIALINFTYGTNLGIREKFPKVHRTDTSEIADAIQRAKDWGSDFIIALPHWGTEYSLRHSRSQERLAKWLADKGCDAIIGAHPHVLQEIETVCASDESGSACRKVPVAYSLGNFISNMSAPNTQLGMMLTLRFTKDRLGNRNMLEPAVTLTWCSRPGHLTKGYTTIPIKEYVGKRSLWQNPWDYDKMAATYERVRKETGIKD